MDEDCDYLCLDVQNSYNQYDEFQFTNNLDQNIQNIVIEQEQEKGIQLGNIKNIKNISKNKVKKTTQEIAQKKYEQIIKNRISAQNSRDKKKAYLEKLEKDFHQSQDKITKLLQQIDILNQQVDQQNQIKCNSICLNCGSKNIGQQKCIEEQTVKQQGLNKLALTLLTLFTIIMIGSYGFQETICNFYQVKQTNINNNIYKQFNQDSHQFLIHKTIQQRREQYINKIQSNNHTQLAPANYHKQKIDSLYCADIYQYEDIDKDITIDFQDDQWIHLIIPKYNLGYFYEKNNSLIIKETCLNETQHNNYQNYYELWCQIKEIEVFKF